MTASNARPTRADRPLRLARRAVDRPGRLAARAALIAVVAGLAAAHVPASATPDLPLVAQTCPKEGRDPSSASMVFQHSCGVRSPDDFTTTPSWRKLELMAVDASTSGGKVVATLFCMSRTSGATSVIARVQSAPSARAGVASVLLPAPLEFGRCAYFVQIAVDRTTDAAQALMVSLRN